MEQNLTRIFTLFGGLALFLYGMDALSHSLETAAGSRLKSLLAAVTGSPVRGVATSGWRGRSHSLGIADSVTVLAATAAMADAAATVIAVRNGSRRTEAKAQASRENGRRGGRPRKAEAA